MLKPGVARHPKQNKEKGVTRSTQSWAVPNLQFLPHRRGGVGWHGLGAGGPGAQYKNECKHEKLEWARGPPPPGSECLDFPFPRHGTPADFKIGTWRVQKCLPKRWARVGSTNGLSQNGYAPIRRVGGQSAAGYATRRVAHIMDFA